MSLKKTKHKNCCTYSLEFPSFPFLKYFPWRSFPVYIANSVIRCDGSARTGRGLIDCKPHFGGWRTRSCKTSFVFCSYIIPFPALSWTCPCVPNHVIYFHIGLFVYCYGGRGVLFSHVDEYLIALSSFIALNFYHECLSIRAVDWIRCFHLPNLVIQTCVYWSEFRRLAVMRECVVRRCVYCTYVLCLESTCDHLYFALKRMTRACF